MVRVSLALYSREEDIDAFATALKRIIHDRDFFLAQYRRDRSGAYRHIEFGQAALTLVDPQQLVDESL